MQTSTVVVRGSHPTLRFAARELARYLRLATGQPLRVLGPRASVPAGAIRIGLAAEFGIEQPAGLTPDDDWIGLRSRGRDLLLYGANPRSVLFAACRYLRELGFRWIRPGRRGEVIPRFTAPRVGGFRIEEQPSYRHRTVCIEGACSERHVVDLIDWMAKQGMNGYFIQFELGTCFWQNWHRHAGHPTREGTGLNDAAVRRIVERVVRELGRRAMRFERMGHGWTCAPLGIAGEGWDKREKALTPARQRMLAEVKGKREFWGGVPLNTNLCYSDPAVRSAMAGRIAAYAGDHPEVRALHVWLADGSNNHCECGRCRKARPADFYIELLNEVDARLAAARLDTKIVFLIYVDLLWPPERQRLRNPDRFILMFAPITRSYLQSFEACGRGAVRTTPYVRNKLELPKNVEVNLAYLRAWQRLFRGDGFDFDYHMIWTCYGDPNQFTLARTLHGDIRSLSDIGLNGYNSCQNQRMSFPHNLLMDVMARTLWDRHVPFRQVVKESFADAFGRDGAKVAVFFKTMSRLWKPFYEPVYLPKADEPRIQRGLRGLAAMPAQIAAARRLVAANREKGAVAVRWSWRYLSLYLDLLDLLLPAFEAYLRGSSDARQRFEETFAFAWRHEPTLHPALDVRGFVNVCRWRIHEVENRKR